MNLDEQSGPDIAELTAGIVSAYVAKNSVRPSDIATVIASVHQALRGLGKPQTPEPEKLQPPVPIRKSIAPDYLISLEDGRRYKSLKRHLTSRGLTPEQYRVKWGLGADYPMVAPNYSKARSDLARSMGLGQSRKRLAAAAAQAPAAGAKKGVRGRPRKVPA